MSPLKIRTPLAPVLLAALAFCATACIPQPTDGELQQMCEHLVTLRQKSKIETDEKKCVAEAKDEKISQRQVLCRISAQNTVEYFVRCRTGEARKP